MTLDDLKQEWRKQNAGTAGRAIDQSAVVGVARRAERAAIANRITAALVIFATLLVLYFFGKMLFMEPTTLAGLGAGMVVAGSLGIIGKILVGIQTLRGSDPGAPMPHFFQFQIVSTEYQIAFARSIGVWISVGSICVGGAMVAFEPKALLYSAGFCVLETVIFLGVCLASRRWVNGYFVPLRDELRCVLAEIEE